MQLKVLAASSFSCDAAGSCWRADLLHAYLWVLLGGALGTQTPSGEGAARGCC